MFRLAQASDLDYNTVDTAELKRSFINAIVLQRLPIMRCLPSSLVALLMLLASSGFCLSAFAQIDKDQVRKFTPSEIDFFENKVRPLLVNHCLECHGDDQEKLRGGLYLTSRKAILEGGDSGPAIVPGEPDESLLIESIRYESYEMPPSGQLDQSDIDILIKWIEMGAPDPREVASYAKPQVIDVEAGKQFWAFKQPVDFPIPETSDNSWPRTDIDRWILASLEKERLQPSQDADRVTLIRRASIALIGLPPTIDQIDAFVDDPDSIDIAFGKVVDQLLQSPHFGERWGRHWLDVVRFAESSGGGRSLMFPHAWRFRDYVIDSFNKDKPFDQFVREQIAGDLLPFKSHEQKIEQIVATGMLALGPTNYEQQDKELLRMEVIDEQVDTIGRAFIGLTLGCARCHDHKFDPIPMTDYYALAGILGGTQSLVDGNVSKYVERPLATEAELKKEREYRKKVASLTKQLAEAEAKLKKIVGVKETKIARRNIKSSSLPGMIIDDKNAKRIGTWIESQHSGSYIDGQYLHDEDKDKGERQIIFTPKFTSGGQYEVRMSYTPGGNRASNVPVTIDHQDGKSTVLVNQSQTPPIDGMFISLGIYRFEADNQSTVSISNKDTDGHVIVDAIQLLKLDDSSSKTKTNRDSTVASSDDSTDNDDLSKTNRDESEKNESEEIAEARKQVEALDNQLKQIKKNAPRPLDVAMSVKDFKKPVDGHLYIRGSVHNPGPIVQRGFISVCCETNPKPKLAEHQSGRLQLAKWITSPDHPLTAKVYVNRVWRHLFGVGIVPTADNFGMMGQKPTHPELLDYLANEFMRDGWSTKKLIRKIMLSRVYRLDSQLSEEMKVKDDANRLLGRAHRRRVDAEVLRDSILFVSGELDLTPGGQTIRKITEYDLDYKFNTVRRSVYVPAFRNSMLELFEVFDFANPNLVTGHRNTSTLPTQALYLMNSPMVIEQSRKAAEKLLQRQEKLNQHEQIEFVFRQTLGRRPTEGELTKTNEYLNSFELANNNSKLEAWSSVYHALFASLDFRYVE